MEQTRVCDFSMLDPSISSETWDFYKLLQEQGPVYEMPETGAYLVTRYDDLRHVLKDTPTFSSDVRSASMGQFAGLHQSILKQGGGWEHVQTLQRTDPPVDTRYRKLLDRVFTIHRVRELIPHIEAVVTELIDGFIDRGECDFNNEFAISVPGIIIAEQSGLDRNEVATFKRWGDAMLGAINHGMWTLIRFPELQAHLREDDSLLKPFVDEVLRWESPRVVSGAASDERCGVGRYADT